MQVTPIERPETLKNTARGAIRKMLVTGQLNRDTLYSANGFADLLGVSRTPVREALLELCAEGYLIAHDGKGFALKTPTDKEVRDFFETRRIIELYVMERVANLLTETDIAALAGHLSRMQGHHVVDDKVAFLESDKAFHLYLVERHGNEHLSSIMNNIRDLISILGHEAIVHSGRSAEVINEHQLVHDALRQRDSRGAVAAMRDHLTATEECLLAQLDSN